MRIIVEDFRPYSRNTLLGFLTLALPEIGLRIKECPLHTKGDRSWIGFPARPWTDAQGQTVWSAMIEFTADADRWGFQSAVIEAVKARFPDALGHPPPAGQP